MSPFSTRRLVGWQDFTPMPVVHSWLQWRWWSIDWKPESGRPGAIWVARRVPDDHVVVVPNYVRIREIDVSNPEFMASPNYMQEAIDRGWYRPADGRPFVWQEAYAPELSVSGIEVSPELNRIVAHCLEKNPGERFQSASDLAFHLISLLSGSAVNKLLLPRC